MPIDDLVSPLNNDLRVAVVEAIHRVRLKIEWRPGKDVKHLEKRIRFGHLTAGTTPAQYESIITTVINDNQAKVYVFQYNDTLYPTLVATMRDRTWLVMVGLDGTMETAFPPSDLDTYLSDSAYHYLSVLEELLR